LQYLQQNSNRQQQIYDSKSSAHNFNFARKLTQNEGFSVPNLAFRTKFSNNFWTIFQQIRI